MKKHSTVLFAFIFSIFFMPCTFADNHLPNPSVSTQNLNTIVAIVNNGIITQTELDNALTEAKAELAASANPAAINNSQLRSMVLQQLIDEKLQLELAHRANITVTNAQITLAIKRIAAGNHLTLIQLKEKLPQQGMSYEKYRALIHKQLLIHEIQQNAIGANVQITPQDVKNALTQYQAQTKSQQEFHVIDIVVSTKKGAEDIIAQLNKGADIDSVAPKNTNDLGWQTTNTLPEIFLQQLSNMQSGDVAGPIEAPNGFHVIKLAGVRGQSSQPSQAQLQNMAFQMKFQDAVKKWLVQLRKTAYIKIN